MARGKKTGGRDFKPGHPGGPGQPRIPEELKQARALNRVQFETLLNKYIFMTGPEINAAIRSQTLPMLDLIICKILALAFNDGDQRRMEFVLDRLIPKAPPLIDIPPAEVIKDNEVVSFEEFCRRADYFIPFPKQVEMMKFTLEETVTRLLLGARNYGKTDYCTIMAIAYEIYRSFKMGLEMDLYTNLIITKSKSRNKAILNEIGIALTKNKIPLDKFNSTEIRVKGLVGQDHSVEAITIKTSMRGRHPKRIVMDDPVTDEDVSESMRDLVKRKYDEAMKLSKNIIVIGQPVHAFDLYAHLRKIIKKMEVPHGSIPQLDADLTALALAGVDKNSIMMSYHLKVPTEGSSIFANLNFMDGFPTGTSVMFIDPSDGGDYTAASVFRAYLEGIAVVGKAWQKEWYHALDDLEDEQGIVKFAVSRGVKKIFFETNSTGRQPLIQLRQIFSPLGIEVVGVHSDSNKHATIVSAGSFSHMIHLSRESDQVYTDLVVKYEKKSKYDDPPDSLARGLVALGLIKAKKG